MSNKPPRYRIMVNYFIQNDQWESISHPNLFVLPDEYQNLNNVKAQVIYDNFPNLRRFNYYLRFFLDDKIQGVKGWVDVPPNAVIPIYDKGQVYVKALRLPKDVKLNFKSDDLYKEKERSKVNKNNNENLMFMDEPEVNKKQAQDLNQQKPKVEANGRPQNINKSNNNSNSKGSNVQSNTMNALDFDGLGEILNSNNNNNKNVNNNNSNNNTNSNNNSNNINNSNKSSGGSSNNNINNNTTNNQPILDIFNTPLTNNVDNNSPNNFTDPNFASIFSNLNITETQNNTHHAQQQQTYDFTSSNNGGSLNEIDKVSTSLSEDEIKDKCNAIISKWTQGVNEPKNLLFLLTTLHEVWSHTTLEIPNMQTLVNDKAAVRTYYKKAMRDLHADKNRDKDFKTQYVASSLYQILNEANSNY